MSSDSIVRLKELGRGSFSVVYLVNYKEKYAVLKELLNIKEEKQYLNEIKILENISKSPNCYPSIICIYEHFKNDKGNINIILEYIEGSVSLEDYIKLNTLNDGDIHAILKSLLYGVEYLHKNNIVHRDLKPANLLIAKEHSIKIIDFGISCIEECKNIAGTLNYFSPELLINIEEKKKLPFDVYKKSDVYSIGVILYLLVNNRLPTHGCNTKQKLKNVVCSEEVFKSTSTKYNEGYNKLINNMLIKDYKLRPTISEVIEEFKKIDSSPKI